MESSCRVERAGSLRYVGQCFAQDWIVRRRPSLAHQGKGPACSEAQRWGGASTRGIERNTDTTGQGRGGWKGVRPERQPRARSHSHDSRGRSLG